MIDLEEICCIAPAKILSRPAVLKQFFLVGSGG
jgi:hypothetical protein